MESTMDQLLKNFTLDFFGQGKHNITPDKLIGKDNVLLLDVRSTVEVESLPILLKHHKNIEAVNIPINEIPVKINEIPKDKFIAVFCPAGARAAITFAYLLSKGFPEVRILDGGYPALTDILKPGPIFKATQN